MTHTAMALTPRGCRCVVQLTILGFILVPIFTYNLWWLVIGYSLVMALVGAYESVSRPSYTFKASTQTAGVAPSGVTGCRVAAGCHRRHRKKRKPQPSQL